MPVADEDLRSTLESVLGLGVRAIARRPSAYSSSCAIEDVEATVDDGSAVSLVFKDLSPDALSPAARAARPPALLDPQREIEAYVEVLGPAGVDAPACLGSVAEPRSGRYWLFLEAVDGVPLWQVGDPAAWEAAAVWLADLHGRGWPGWHAHLLRYDAHYLRGWIDRAVAFAPEGSLDGVVAGWERIVERLSAWPRTFVHGEFYPSNVLVRQGNGGPAIVPVDWEMAGVGPGVLDLAALTSGGWTAAARERLALAYHGSLPRARRPSADDLLDALDHCRLFVAVQWLGWSCNWSPPAAHDHDWLTEALALARRLGMAS